MAAPLQESFFAAGRSVSTYSFFDSTELLEFLSEGVFLCVPCKAAVRRKISMGSPWRILVATTWGLTYPMKSLDMMMDVMSLRELDGLLIAD